MPSSHSGFVLKGNIDGNALAFKAINMPDPVDAQDYATKAYADSLLSSPTISTPTLIAPVNVLDSAGGSIIATIDIYGNLYIKGRIITLE